jgi:two-component system sensor histidine kinase VicK
MLRTAGLRSKILFGIAGVVVLFGLTVMIFAKTVLYQNLLEKLEKRGISIARHMAANSIDPVLTEKYFELSLMAKDFMKSEEDVAYIFVLDRTGKVLAHTFDNGFPVELKEVNRAGSGQKYSVQRILTEKEDLIDIAVPLLNGEAGVVHVGFSERNIRQEINSIIKLISWMVLAVSIIGVIIAIFLSRLIAKPLSTLTAVAEAVGGGDFEQRVVVHSNDEIGRLGKSFNAMVEMRKQAETSLKESERKLSDITSHLAEGIYTLDESGRVTFMNPEAVRLLGWSVEELNAKGPHNLIHFQKPDGSLLSETECKMHNVIKTGERYSSSDEVFVRKDGTFLPISVITAPIVGDGKTIASVTAFRDITEWKKMEQEREKLIAELQKALATIKKLFGILPICSSCKKIRDDKGSWNQLESYIQEHSEAKFSHGLCPDCAKRLYPEYFKG